MFIGAHSIIYSIAPEEDRAFLGDVLRLPNVDVGEGWLIFGLPPAEVAVHPSNENDVHEFYLMCDYIDAFVEEMKTHNIACTPVQDQGWVGFHRSRCRWRQARHLSAAACAPGAHAGGQGGEAPARRTAKKSFKKTAMKAAKWLEPFGGRRKDAK